MFDHAIAAIDYCAPWDKVISELKFQADPALAHPLAQLLVPHIWARWQLPSPPRGLKIRRLRAGAPSLILPVPLSPLRLQERGFNQAGLIAKHIGQTINLPVNHQVLRRRQHTKRLMSMQAHERQSHIRGAFSLAPFAPALLRQRHIALVDDVLTTGATLNELARILWQGGAREVSVWVVARTPNKQPIRPLPREG
jgi:ComF family protein